LFTRISMFSLNSFALPFLRKSEEYAISEDLKDNFYQHATLKLYNQQKSGSLS
jgi:hypothetical protein